MRSWIVAALVSLTACVRPSSVVGVACTDSTDCTIGGSMGTCESTGFCSYPDSACTSGHRYSPGAGDGLASTCVGGAATCGAKDEACCAGVCASDLVCSATTTTCVCGGEDEPCCGGSMCGANLACGAGATCACGSIGEPCCGGTTCDGGLTCSAGSCTGGALQVAVGMGTICALRPDHTVWCWGSDWKPWALTTPGLLNTTMASLAPRQIPGATDVAAIRAAEMHACARKLDGTLWCWGHNENGQLGNGTNTSSPVAVQVPGLTNVTLFDGGRHHTCALGSFKSTPGLWCWGRGGRMGHPGANNTPDATMGRLGNNDIVDHNTPVAVDLSVAAGAGQTVRALSTGAYHSCIAMSDNTVWCWGRNSQGQLGDGTTTSSKVPVKVNLAGITLPTGATIDEVSCSDGSGYNPHSSCLRLSTGAVYCWGNGDEMGDGTTTARNAPTTAVTTTALGAATFTQLAAANTSRCGLTTAGDVWCWGVNSQGILGISDGNLGTSKTTPAKTTVLTGATQLDMSHRTACAIDGQQRLWCWGTNRRGQIRGAGANAIQPTQVSL